MKNYETNIYDYVEKNTGIHVVKAVTTYAGKAVYAFAKCDPEDNFDIAFGTQLALKRLDAKIAKKRLIHAKERVKFCKMNLDFIENERRRTRKALENAKVFYYDSLVEAKMLEADIKELEESTK